MIKLALVGLKLLKFGKIGGTLLTMVFSLAVYAAAFGWRYAAGFIGLLFLHEMGHYAAARQRGLDVGAPTFIPFVGAWIELREAPMDVETEAYVAMAGPFIGTLGACACYFIGREAHSQILLAIAYSGFFLNFFNLIPLSPLDGGRITAILSPRVWFLGVPLLIAAFFYTPSPLLVLIAIAAVPALIQAWKHDPDDPETARYYNVPLEVRAQYGAMYLCLALYLAIMTHETHGMIGPV